MILEDQLRGLRDLPVALPEGLAGQSWRRGRRRRPQALGAGVTVAAAGVAVAGGVAATQTGRAPTRIVVSPGAPLATVHESFLDHPSQLPGFSVRKIDHIVGPTRYVTAGVTIDRFEYARRGSAPGSTGVPVIADVIESPQLASFTARTLKASYVVAGDDTGDEEPVDLGAGVRGQSLSFRDAGQSVTYNVIAWVWAVRTAEGASYERVSVIKQDGGVSAARSPHAAAQAELADFARKVVAGALADVAPKPTASPSESYVDGPPTAPFPVTASQRAASASRRAALDAADPALAAIGLPDPAPGFPARRQPDQPAIMSGFGPGVGVLARTWLLGMAPYTYTPLPGGVSEGSVSGATATVTVAHAGAFSTSAGPDGKAGGSDGYGYPVTGTTTARGVTATVVAVGGGQTELLLSVGGYDISVSGSDGDGAPLPVQRLVDLADALTGIPAT